jgi:FAD/FMN-containing dehydrogenase
MSISGKNIIEWGALQTALGDIDTQDAPPLVKKKSRDFFWYSPILNRQLGRCFGDLVALPKDRAELARCISVAHAYQAPIVVRGGGTGNYGQAVPLQGGLIVDMTGIDEIVEIGEDWVRVEAGCKIRTLNDALKRVGRELPIFPSTQDIATIGGFVAGGSSGIGSIAHGMLRDEGNIRSVTALSVDPQPQAHVFTGADINLIHHAWGINGVITELTLRTEPAGDWINCIASYDTYRGAYAAAIELGHRRDLARKLVSSVHADIVPYFGALEGRIDAGRHLMLTLIARADLAAYEELIADTSGRFDLALDGDQMAAEGLPHVFEFAYNHTTLQALKKDRTVTYLQVGNHAPLDAELIDRLQPVLGDDVLMHHEFARLAGQLVAFDLPIIRYTCDARLAEIAQVYEQHGCPVSNPHTFIIEDGGMKSADYRHLAWKKRLDPAGLLNPGKSKSWDKVKHLSADEIEALEVTT